jgi:hypothetical protein
MSTEMKGTTRHLLTRFYGGKDRGVCLQVTIRELMGRSSYEEGYITVNKQEALELARSLIMFADDTLEEEEC